MKKFLNEFKEFALKGNVMALAVGVIIGAAFQSVVTSLTDNILSPIIGLFTKQNFDTLHAEFLGVTLGYGAFITAVINFIIMALVVFFIAKALNKVSSMVKKPGEPEVPDKPATRPCPYCMTDISRAASRCPHCTSEVIPEDPVQ